MGLHFPMNAHPFYKSWIRSGSCKETQYLVFLNSTFSHTSSHDYKSYTSSSTYRPPHYKSRLRTRAREIRRLSSINCFSPTSSTLKGSHHDVIQQLNVETNLQLFVTFLISSIAFATFQGTYSQNFAVQVYKTLQ